MTGTEHVIQLEEVKNGQIQLAEVVSLFDGSNLKDTCYSGYILKKIFNMALPTIKDNDILRLDINMFDCTIELFKGNDLKESIDLVDSTEEEQYNIIKNLMEVNHTKYLISYLGNIIQLTNPQ